MAVLLLPVMSIRQGKSSAALRATRDAWSSRVSQLRAAWTRRTGKSARAARMGAVETYVRTRHGLIAVADSGTAGPAILFLHGNSACKEAFFEQFRHFSDRYRLVGFDLPGHGVSDNGDPKESYNIPAYAEVAETVLAALGIGEVVVFGWSLGGYNALELAARGKVRVRGLAITGTVPLRVIPDDWVGGMNAESPVALAGRRYLSSRERAAFASCALAPLSERSRFLHRTMKRTDGRARESMAQGFAEVDWPRQMRIVTGGMVPFAVMNGSDDPFINHEYVARIPYGAHWRGAPQSLEGGRHAPFFTVPEAFNRQFEMFVRDALARSASYAAE